MQLHFWARRSSQKAIFSATRVVESWKDDLLAPLLFTHCAGYHNGEEMISSREARSNFWSFFKQNIWTMFTQSMKSEANNWSKMFWNGKRLSSGQWSKGKPNQSAQKLKKFTSSCQQWRRFQSTGVCIGCEICHRCCSPKLTQKICVAFAGG